MELVMDVRAIYFSRFNASFISTSVMSLLIPKDSLLKSRQESPSFITTKKSDIFSTGIRYLSLSIYSKRPFMFMYASIKKIPETSSNLSQSLGN